MADRKQSKDGRGIMEIGAKLQVYPLKKEYAENALV